MNKKTIFLYALVSIITQVIFAQTQEGYVRTLERPEVPSIALEGVVLRVHGEHNAIVSNANGLFHISMPGKHNGDSYTLQQIKKNGYELVDQGVIGRTYAFSDHVPLTVIMVSTTQLQADKQRIENNAYLTAERNYNNQINELKQQLADQTIDEKEYHTKAMELQQKLEHYQLLIGDLADHYARTDYTFLNEKERAVNLYIESGELERADSLLSTMFNPIDILERNRKDLAEAYQRLAEGQGMMDNAKKDLDYVLREQEKAAEYLYQLYTIALARLDNEKAKLYIETRAALDSTNVRWQGDAGLFNCKIANYSEAYNYYTKGLEQSKIQYGDSGIWVAMFYNNIGGIHSSYFDKYDEALKYHKMALDILKSILGDDDPRLAASYNNIGSIYSRQKEFSKALYFYFNALRISDDIYYIANLYNNIGYVYASKHKYNKALTYFTTSLQIFNDNLGEINPQSATIYNNIGDLYRMRRKFSNAIEYHIKALDIWRKTLGDEHPDVALSYYNIGEILNKIGDYHMALKFHNKALEIYKKIFDENNLNIAASYNSIGYTYYKLGKYDHAINLLEKAYTIANNILGENNETTKYYKYCIIQVMKWRL